MKHLYNILAISAVCLVTPVAEAGLITDLWSSTVTLVTHPVVTAKHIVSWGFSPINCAAGWVGGQLRAHDATRGDLVSLGKCVVVNANVNPLTGQPPILP